MPDYECHRHLLKASCKISSQSLEDILDKGRKSAKKPKLCLIMLVIGGSG